MAPKKAPLTEGIMNCGTVSSRPASLKVQVTPWPLAPVVPVEPVVPELEPVEPEPLVEPEVLPEPEVPVLLESDVLPEPEGGVVMRLRTLGALGVTCGWGAGVTAVTVLRFEAPTG